MPVWSRRHSSPARRRAGGAPLLPADTAAPALPAGRLQHTPYKSQHAPQNPLYQVLISNAPPVNRWAKPRMGFSPPVYSAGSWQVSIMVVLGALRRLLMCDFRD